MLSIVERPTYLEPSSTNEFNVPSAMELELLEICFSVGHMEVWGNSRGDYIISLIVDLIFGAQASVVWWPVS